MAKDKWYIGHCQKCGMFGIQVKDIQVMAWDYWRSDAVWCASCIESNDKGVAKEEMVIKLLSLGTGIVLLGLMVIFSMGKFLMR